MELLGSLVRLRPVRVDDVGPLVRIFGEPEVARWWVGYGRARIERELLGDQDDTTVSVIEVGEEVAGIIQCYGEADPEYRSAALESP